MTSDGKVIITLKEIFGERLISKNWQVVIFLCGYLKGVVYKNNFCSLEELKINIENVINNYRRWKEF